MKLVEVKFKDSQYSFAEDNYATFGPSSWTFVPLFPIDLTYGPDKDQLSTRAFTIIKNMVNINIRPTPAYVGPVDTIILDFYVDDRCNGDITTMPSSGEVYQHDLLMSFRNPNNLDRFKHLKRHIVNVYGGCDTPQQMSMSSYQRCFDFPMEMSMMKMDDSHATERYTKNILMAVRSSLNNYALEYGTRIEFIQ